MKRFAVLLLALCWALVPFFTACSEGVATGLDYTLAEKLQKQLLAGSGFSGTAEISLTPVEGREGEAISTKQPILLDWTYLHIRADSTLNTPVEDRVDVFLGSGDSASPLASFAWRDGMAYGQSVLLGESWYALGNPRGEDGLPQAAKDAAANSPLPSLAGFVLPLLANLGDVGAANLTEALSTYTTKLDLWIEAYRKDAVLGKLKDGTTTMEVDYVIPPSAIKAQLKQLVLDLLSDQATLLKLQALMPAEYADLLLQPGMQRFYFFAVDSLPLEGDLTISRTVSVKGDTLALELSLPLYDGVAGAAELRYSRTAGEGDIPGENIIELVSGVQTLRLDYREYSSMTDVTVYQGAFVREITSPDAFKVQEDESSPQNLSAAFTLTNQTTEAADAEGRDTLTHKLALTLAPMLYTTDADGVETPFTDAQKEMYLDFTPIDLTVDASFSGKPSKDASTAIDLSLRLASEKQPQVLDVKFSGKTRKNWVPTALPYESLPLWSSLTPEERTSLETAAAAQAGLMFLPYLALPASPTPAAEATPAP